ncbi:hypothetical protein EVAR_45880_1 [Eumeta japonica]|uniref:Uncharacterized protein n=1 Tax=Eumeta variegata TaxID=151549 RepID=A0A4C1XS12_EUMVA|nr:hypothetical protein EVAR_45880_1 [Eumeta japonica]
MLHEESGRVVRWACPDRKLGNVIGYRSETDQPMGGRAARPSAARPAAPGEKCGACTCNVTFLSDRLAREHVRRVQAPNGTVGRVTDQITNNSVRNGCKSNVI